MERTRADRPAVLVTDAARGSAVAIVRSLGRRGFRVIAADASADAPGFTSRFACERLVYPPPEREPEAFVAALAQAARERRVDLIIPVTDLAILPLSAARERFAGVARLAIPEATALARVSDKLAMAERAREVGLGVPRGVLVRTAEEAVEHAPELGFPVVLKPRFSCRYRPGVPLEKFEVAFADGAEAVRRAMKVFEGRSEVVLQEYRAGVGQGVELLLEAGRPLLAFQHERLREVPVHGGASAFRKSVPLDPVLYAKSVELLAPLSWTGLVMVEFKIGPAGATFVEVNGRVWGSLPLAVHAGVDFPAALAELLLHGELASAFPAPGQYRAGVRSRNLELDLLWIGAVLLGRRRYPFLPAPPRRAALRAVLQLLNPACRFDVLSLEDPRPGLVELRRTLSKLRGKLS